jgi:hypothetical protein
VGDAWYEIAGFGFGYEVFLFTIEEIELYISSMNYCCSPTTLPGLQSLNQDIAYFAFSPNF